MRRCFIPPLALIALLFVHPAGGAANGTSGCQPRGSMTVLRTPTTRVFYFKDRAYGCLYRLNRPFRIDKTDYQSDYGAPDITLVRAAGPYVGFVYVLDEAIVGQHLYIRVVDLQTGRARWPDAGALGRHSWTDDRVFRLVMASSGAVAWIAQTYRALDEGERPPRNCRPNPTRGPSDFDWCDLPPEVRRRDSRGPHLLDRGHRIARKSLRLHGSTLSWAKGGTRRTATLK